MDTMPIFKSDVLDKNAFELLLNLYDCHISFVEDEYYIVEGTPENIEDFRVYWTEQGDLNECC